MRLFFGCGLCLVTVVIGPVGFRTRVYSWTRVGILMCPVTTAIGHKPFPYFFPIRSQNQHGINNKVLRKLISQLSNLCFGNKKKDQIYAKALRVGGVL